MLRFLQGGVEVIGTRTLYLSGQAAFADGKVLHPWADVVRLNWYLRADQLEDFLTGVQPAFKQRLDEGGCRAPGVLLGVASLAFPEMLCEFEATAVR